MPVAIEKEKNTFQLVSPIIINTKDSSILIEIPAAEFERGDGKNSDCPQHTVYLDRYYIGVYTVTNRQYKQFVDETGHRPPDVADWGTPIWKGKSYPESYTDHPVVCVSWEDAATYCRWAGGTLPTEAQWEKAARGPKGFTYPWGNDWDQNLCRNSNNKGSQTTCTIYEYPKGASGYGCYNLSGNVWEWCSDWYGSDYYKNSPPKNPTGPDTGSYRVGRGGGWGSVGAEYFRAARRYRNDPSYRNDYGGFRLLLAPGQQAG